MQDPKPIVLWAATTLASVMLVLPTTACVGTETGNPAGPDYTHRVEPTEVDATAVQHVPQVPTLPELLIEGGPGSVLPATGTMWAWPLESNLPASTAAVESDGSFSLEVPALPGELVRLQVRAGPEEWSPPLDIIVPLEGTGFTRFISAKACLRTSPELALQIDAADGAEDAIIITNHCDENVTRSAARVREVSPGVSIVDDGLLDLAPGAQSTIRVRVDDDESSPVNVIFSLQSPVQEIRAITVGLD